MFSVHFISAVSMRSVPIPANHGYTKSDNRPIVSRIHLYLDGNIKVRVVPTPCTFYRSWVYYDIANWYAIAYCDCCFAHIPTSTWTSGLQIMVPYRYLVARISPTSAMNVSKSENSTGCSFWYSFCGTFT